MVEVVYDGNLGNNLFQYCFGRILAESLGYRLLAEPIKGFPGTFDVIEGKDFTGFRTIALSGQLVDLSFLDNQHLQCHILLTGYFQRYDYYKARRSDIREWLRLEDDIKFEPGINDVVLGIRRGNDYIPKHGLPLSYYETALSQLHFEKVFICTNEPNDPFIIHLAKKYSAIVREPGALDNIKFIKKFNKIVISNSTFLWWAAFLSDANEIIFPVPKNGFWSDFEPISKNINLAIHENRYKYIGCEKYESKFISEKMRIFSESILNKIKTIIRTLFPFLRRKKMKKDDYDFNEKFDF